MPRKRMIDPEMYRDENVARLSYRQRWILTGCITHADDDGRLKGAPRKILGDLFALDRDVTEADVAADLEAIARVMRSFQWYTRDGQIYIALAHWTRYQAVPKARPSILPPAPDGYTNAGALPYSGEGVPDPEPAPATPPAVHPPAVADPAGQTSDPDPFGDPLAPAPDPEPAGGYLEQINAAWYEKAGRILSPAEIGWLRHLADAGGWDPDYLAMCCALILDRAQAPVRSIGIFRVGLAKMAEQPDPPSPADIARAQQADRGRTNHPIPPADRLIREYQDDRQAWESLTPEQRDKQKALGRQKIAEIRAMIRGLGQTGALTPCAT